MRGAGGYPGTNLCLGLARGYKVLFGAGAQAGARKVLVILTDGENRYSDFAYQDVAVSDSLPVGEPPHRKPGAEHLSADRILRVARHQRRAAGRPRPQRRLLLSGRLGASTRTRPRTAPTTTGASTTWTCTRAASRQDEDPGIEIFVVGFGVDGAPTRYDVQRRNEGAHRLTLLRPARDVTGSSDTQGDAEQLAMLFTGSVRVLRERGIAGRQPFRGGVAARIDRRDERHVADHRHLPPVVDAVPPVRRHRRSCASRPAGRRTRRASRWRR